ALALGCISLIPAYDDVVAPYGDAPFRRRRGSRMSTARLTASAYLLVRGLHHAVRPSDSLRGIHKDPWSHVRAGLARTGSLRGDAPARPGADATRRRRTGAASRERGRPDRLPEPRGRSRRRAPSLAVPDCGRWQSRPEPHRPWLRG